jgi:hypothetical protein
MVRLKEYIIGLAVIVVFVTGVSAQHQWARALSLSPSPTPTPRLVPPAPACKTPHVALVSPEFIVLAGGKPSSPPPLITVVGTCLGAIYFVPSHVGGKTETLPNTSSNDPFQLTTVTGNIAFNTPDTYRVCADSVCTSDGPRILVTSDAACGLDNSDPAFITQLSSESPLAESDSPAVAGCTAPSIGADQVITIDGSSGRSSLSNRRPLQLDVNKTVQVIVNHKNPFRETYSLDSSTQPIHDDDIGTFLSLLVPSLGGGSSQQGSTPPDSTTQSVQKAQKDATNLQTASGPQDVIASADNVQRSQTFALNLLKNKIELAKTKDVPVDEAMTHVRAAEKNLSDFNTLNALIKADPKKALAAQTALGQKADDTQQSLRKAADTLSSVVVASPGKCARILQSRIDDLVLNYRLFATAYNDLRNQIVKRPIGDVDDCSDLLDGAKTLWTLANMENGKLLDDQIALNLRDVATSNNSSSSQGQSGPAKAAGSGTGGSADNTTLTSSNCLLKALHTKVSPALSSNMTSLESVLANPGSFVSSLQIGPYADPTQVDLTLTKTIPQNPPLSGLTIADFNAAIDDCVTPPAPKNDGTKGQVLLQKPAAPAPSVSTHHQPSRSFFHNAAFRITDSKPADLVSYRTEAAPKTQQNQPAPAAQAQAAPASQQSSSDQNRITLQNSRINFGKERFIVSIGAVWAHLSHQSIGTGLGIPTLDASGNPFPSPSPSPSPSPTPPAITTLITQTDHSKFRISPMAFLNTRVLDWNKWNQPLYFTFGITAKSSDSGVKPEYLLGFSQAICDRRFFITSGAYLGQQSSLGGNLKFNQQVPSGLTGSPTISSTYGVGLSFGISWRVPGLAK